MPPPAPLFPKECYENIGGDCIENIGADGLSPVAVTYTGAG